MFFLKDKNFLVESEKPMNTAAIEIKNAYKSYGKLQVIKNLNLTVPKGAMFVNLKP
jgi:hypothetical protein